MTTPSSTPTVHTPSVTTPSVNAPSTLSQHPPTLPYSSGAPSSPASSSSPPSTSASRPSTGATPGSRSTVQSGARSARPPASSRVSSVAHARSHRWSVSRHSRRAEERAENRHLRQVVQRYHGCLGSLDARSRGLLSLRAGLHGSPRSARAVARILHISPGRERLLEQMSLLTLQSTGGGCGSPRAVTSAPATGAAQLTATAPWVAQSSAAPVSTSVTARPASPSSSSNGSRSHVRSGGGRSVKPVVITPSATRTVEQAATGQGSLVGRGRASAILAMAVSLVLLPGVRRRLLPLLAGAPPADGHAGPTGNGRHRSWHRPPPPRRPLTLRLRPRRPLTLRPPLPPRPQRPSRPPPRSSAQRLSPRSLSPRPSVRPLTLILGLRLIILPPHGRGSASTQPRAPWWPPSSPAGSCGCSSVAAVADHAQICSCPGSSGTSTACC